MHFSVRLGLLAVGEILVVYPLVVQEVCKQYAFLFLMACTIFPGSE